jgi:hypothetical protein
MWLRIGSELPEKAIVQPANTVSFILVRIEATDDDDDVCFDDDDVCFDDAIVRFEGLMVKLFGGSRVGGLSVWLELGL